MSNEPIEATTWEQCAQHVEAGGVVEVLGATGAWRASWRSAPFYRHSAAAPGTGGWFRRRLLPLPAAAQATTEPTGAERYLTERMAYPEYAAAYEVAAAQLAAIAAPAIEVPAGHELVVLPCDVVDAWREGWGVVIQERMRHKDAPLVAVVHACRDAVARRPKPAPKTERVHWSQAVGRKDPHDGTITMIRFPRIYFGQDSGMDVTDPDGLVEVLVDGES